jgi:hypothetical protein
MPTLKNVAPDLVAELATVLVEARRAELAEQLDSVVIDRCTHGEDDDLGYVYLMRPTPSPHFAKLAAPVAETVSFYMERGLNVDVDHDGHLYGVEFIGRPDVTATLREADAL